MTTKRLKITGSLPIHGKKPGDEFEIEVDADGIPLDILWRKRLADEERHKVGAVAVITSSTPTHTGQEG